MAPSRSSACPIFSMWAGTLPGAKKALPILAILGFFCAIPFIQQSTLNRLSSFFHAAVRSETFQATDATELAESAVASTNGRMQLQWRAIQLTMKHPLLGVGPSNFEDGVEAMVEKEEGQRSGWQVAHNTYLQVAADTGVGVHPESPLTGQGRQLLLRHPPASVGEAPGDVRGICICPSRRRHR